jgi:hypothetical protein
MFSPFSITSTFFEFSPEMVAKIFIKKMKSDSKFENIHLSTQFLALILNMIVLSHKSLVLMIKIEIYRQKSSFLDQNLVKVIFLNKEKKRRKTRCVLL